MSKTLNHTLAGIALLVLPAALSPASGAEPDSAVAPYASEVPSYAVRGDKSGTFLDEDEASMPIAQSIDFIVDQYLQQRGGYESLKSIVSVDYYGTRHVGSERYPLQRHEAPPNRSRILIKISESSNFESIRSDQGIRLEGSPPGIGTEAERVLLKTFDFYGTVVDWKMKNYAIKRRGMEKLPGVLSWKLEVDRPDGYRQILYLDSRYGDIVKELVVNARGVPIVEIARHDFRAVEGVRFPFAVEYKSPTGEVLASDRLERIEMKRRPS
jgi:hypothetical protein